jgi:murein tripeptide amidase MpaA
MLMCYISSLQNFIVHLLRCGNPDGSAARWNNTMQTWANTVYVQQGEIAMEPYKDS